MAPASALFLSLSLLFSQLAVASPQPISIPPSQHWDGVDGQWSTFDFQLGSPLQHVRLLPASAAGAVSPILSLGCSPSDGDSCPDARGGLFTSNSSHDWKDLGVYQYTTSYNQAGLLGDVANASYGLDTVQLGGPSSNAPILDQATISALVSDTYYWYYVGQFGLSPRPVNVSSVSNNYPTTLSNLRSRTQVPSTSWAYTAGSHGQSATAFGSLTLGGYDALRYEPSSVNFNFGIDTSRDLIVGLQLITSDKSIDGKTSAQLLPNPTFIEIDTAIPAIVLPMDACTAFEHAFNLTYYTQNGQGYYLLDNDQHNALTTLNPTVSFTLGRALAGGSSVTIKIPYSAFDLQLSPPLGLAGTRYFPLQRGNSSADYVLGRTFLQHAYVIADYDRGNFTVNQAKFPTDNKTDIRPIELPQPGEVTSLNSGQQPMTSTSLSGGAIAGIVIGSLAGVSAIVGALIFMYRRRRRQQRTAYQLAAELDPSHAKRPHFERAKTDFGDVYEKDHATRLEADSAQRSEMGGSKRDSRPEMDGGAFAARGELAGWDGESTLRSEMDGVGTGDRSWVSEGRFATGTGTLVSEVDGRDTMVSEMEAVVSEGDKKDKLDFQEVHELA